MIHKKLLFILSVAFFMSAQVFAHVDLDYPTGGETFTVADTITIDWHISIDHGPCTWDLLFSSDGGTTWENIAVGLPKSQQEYNWVVPNTQTSQGQIKVYMDNSNYPDFEDTSGDFTIDTPTGIQNGNSQADRLELHAAYPNPFNSSTLITFEMPFTSEVQIDIYDILGNKIRTIFHDKLEAGRHQVSWNAADLPSGIYFYNITAGQISETRRLTLVK